MTMDGGTKLDSVNSISAQMNELGLGGCVHEDAISAPAGYAISIDNLTDTVSVTPVATEKDFRPYIDKTDENGNVIHRFPDYGWGRD